MKRRGFLKSLSAFLGVGGTTAAVATTEVVTEYLPRDLSEEEMRDRLAALQAERDRQAAADLEKGFLRSAAARKSRREALLRGARELIGSGK